MTAVLSAQPLLSMNSPACFKLKIESVQRAAGQLHEQVIQWQTAVRRHTWGSAGPPQPQNEEVEQVAVVKCGNNLRNV